MSATYEGPRHDTAGTPEDLDQTPADRLEAIETRLASDLPDNPGMGELAVRAEALADAHAMASDHPEQVGQLVPDIVRTVRAASNGSRSKGRQFLVGAYDSDVRREGMAALAALDEAQLASSEERTATVLRAVTVVLETTDSRPAHGPAIRTLGTVATARPEFTADWLSTGPAGERLPRFTGQFETVLSGTVDADELSDLLRTTAVLTGHADLSRLVRGLPRSVLEDCAEVDDYRVRIWTHVISRQLEVPSPVDADRLWTRLEEADSPGGVYWWLLWAHTTGDIPVLDGDDQLAAFLQLGLAARATSEAVRLPGITLDDRLDGDTTVAAALGRLLTEGESRVRRSARKGLAAMAGDESLAQARRAAAVDALRDTVEEDRSDSTRVRRTLKELLEDRSLPRNREAAVVETLESVLLGGDDSSRKRIARVHLKVAARETLSTDLQAALLDVFAETITDEQPVIGGTLGKGVANLAVSPTLSLDHRTVAVDVLRSALDHRDDAVRAATVDTLADLTDSEGLASDHRAALVDAVTTALDDENVRIRTVSARAIVQLADDPGSTVDHESDPARVIVTALDDDRSAVRLEALRGLASLLAEDSISPERAARLVDGFDGDETEQVLEFVSRETAFPMDLRTTAATELADALADALDDREPVERVAGLACDRTLPVDCRSLLIESLIDAFTGGIAQRQIAGEVAELAGATTLDWGSPTRGTVPGDVRTELVDALAVALSHSDYRIRKNAVSGLEALANRDHLSSEVRTALVDTLEQALENHYFFDSVGPKIPRALGKLVVTDPAASEALDRTVDVLVRALQGPENATRTHRENSVFVERCAVDALRRLVERNTVTTTHVHRIVGALEPALDSSSVPRRAADALADCARDDGVPADIAASLLDSLVSLLDPDDEKTRQAAARGVRAVCQSHPAAASRVGADRVAALGPHLLSADATTTAHLLAACQRVSAHDATPITPLAPDVRRLLTEANPSVQSRALDLLSLLSSSVGGHGSTTPDRARNS